MAPRLFREGREEGETLPIILQSVNLPRYIHPIFDKIPGLLKGLGYKVLPEGGAWRADTFVERKQGHGGSSSYEWISRGLYVHYHEFLDNIELSVCSTEVRRDTALKIADGLSNQINNDAKGYLPEDCVKFLREHELAAVEPVQG